MIYKKIYLLFIVLVACAGCSTQNKFSPTELTNRLRSINLNYWADIYEAHALEEKGKYNAALKLYQDIPKNEAPSLDARLGIIRIDWFLNNNFDATTVASLEKDCRTFRRKDLINKLSDFKSLVFPPKPSLARPEPRPSIDLLESAKQLWNKNENEKALKIISQIIDKPKSPTETFKALYMKGRIFREHGEFNVAKQSFLTITKSKAPSELKLKSLKQLAWMKLLSGNNLAAQDYFQKAISLINTESRNITLSNTDKKLLADDLPHLYFWLASLEKNPSRKDALMRLASEYKPFSYYELLNMEDSPYSAVRSFFSSSFTDIPENDFYNKTAARNLINKLNSVKFISPEISKHEIDWHYPETTKTLSNLQTLLTLGSLYTNFTSPDESVKLSERTLLRPHRFSSFAREEIERTAGAVLSISFPTPYFEIYQKANEETGVPLPLLLAISRSESQFDANARSSADAQGLMQLLPKTAELEGGNPEELFTPEKNIHLGARHLKRLLEKFNNNEVLAIAAYNAGASAVERWLERTPKVDRRWIEEISFQETRNYVKKVLVAKNIYLSILKTTKTDK